MRCALLFHFVPATGKFFRQYPIWSAARPGTGSDDQIHRRHALLMQAKGFADGAFDTIAIYRVAGRAYRYGQSKPRLSHLVGKYQHRKAAIGKAPSFFVDDVKLRFLREPLRVSESQHNLVDRAVCERGAGK